MNIQTALGQFGNVGDLALELRKALTAIAAGWNVEHHPDGTHKFLPSGPRILGQWTDFTPVLSSNLGSATITTNYTCRFSVLHEVVVVMFYFDLTITGAPSALILALPVGVTATHYSGNVAMDSAGASVLIHTAPGGTALSLYRNTMATGTWPNGANVIAGTAIIPIQ